MQNQYSFFVVEDEDLIRENLIKKINSLDLGLEFVGSSDNGKSALRLIKQIQPDIVFTDIMMPIMDGLELAEILHFEYSKIKMVIVTGHGDFSLAQKAIRFGVLDYILKPIDINELRKVILRISGDLAIDKENVLADIYDINNEESYTKEEIVDIVEEFIEENFSHEITLGSIADEVGFTPDYLSKLFKKYKMESPIKFLIRLRMDEAKRLLIEKPRMNVKTVGEKVGYFDQYYFSRVFKSKVGIYPTEYRNKKLVD